MRVALTGRTSLVSRLEHALVRGVDRAASGPNVLDDELLGQIHSGSPPENPKSSPPPKARKPKVGTFWGPFQHPPLEFFKRSVRTPGERGRGSEGCQTSGYVAAARLS